MNGRLRACLIASLLAGLGCAGPFRAGAPVDVEKRWYGTVYRQDGRRLDVLSIASGLEDVEGAREDARSARSYLTGSIALAVAGGAATGIAFGAALNGDASGTGAALLAAGVCAGGVSALLGRAGRSRLERAIGAYNADARSPAPISAIVPWAAVSPGGRDRLVAGGLAFEF